MFAWFLSPEKHVYQMLPLMRIVAVACLGLCMSLQASAQSAALPLPSDPGAWGEPVNGVQLRLAAVPTSPNTEGVGLPLAFEVQLHNAGAENAFFIAEAIVHPEIEIDGVWYGEGWGGSCCTKGELIAPGLDSTPHRLRVGLNQIYALNTQPARKLILTPGQHVVRVRSTSSSDFYISSFGALGAERIVLVSNKVIVNVADASASDRSGK